MARKLKQSELKEVRAALIKEQGGKCPICGGSLLVVTEVNRVVDHNHDTGFIRGVLCRACNRAEGVIKGATITYAKAGNNPYFMIQTLRRLADYWEKHQTPQTEFIYPGHKTEAEKRDAKNRKARLAYSTKRKGASNV